MSLVDAPDLFAWRPPPARKIDTSIAAAESMKPSVTMLRQRVLAYIENQGGRGATLDECSARLGILMQTASARVRELADAGCIKDTGDRRKTRTGRSARVYIATGRTL